ncbi:hypothetical protein [uncultured Desulfuromusa sp.]|uniref:hypothetical protein n=1 Tax=uncultured Desulfuromusa sp. TaxID=219183 RepID=UPI002AA8A1DB|nr:hypothetical protein [uncultured Desulfuromusa sp.]
MILVFAFCVLWLLGAYLLEGNRWLKEAGCWISQGLNLALCIRSSTADEAVSSRIDDEGGVYGR